VVGTGGWKKAGVTTPLAFPPPNNPPGAGVEAGAPPNSEGAPAI